ncbi:MAG: beta-galactosidase trimerization domain-containing protein [Bacteroidota bacterium]
MKQKICFLLVPFAFVFSVSLSAVDTISIRTVERQYKEVDTSFYNTNCIALFDNLYDRLAMADPDVADTYISRLSDMGFDVVIMSGRHFRLNYVEEWPQIAQNAKILADVCHKHGMKIIEHQDFTIPLYKNNQFLLDHLDWMQQDVRTGEIWRWACPNNEEFLQFYGDYLKDFQRISGVDGYMLDELDMAGATACGCKYCRQRYEEQFGKPMSYEMSDQGGEGNMTIARYKSYIKPVAKSKILNEIRQVNPKSVILTYCSDFSDSRIAARGHNLSNEAAYYSPFVGWEVMAVDCFAGWRPWVRFGKMRAVIGNYYGIPTWSLNREQRSKEGVYFAWALSQSVKNSIWHTDFVTRDTAESEYYKQFLKWENVMPFQHARCLTDVGFMLSNYTRFVDPGREFFWLDAMGWADMLLEDDLQFDVLLDGDTDLPDRLGKYNVMLLIGQAAMSEDQKENLSNWVAGGGSVILTTHTSLYDEYGAERNQFLLSDIAGVTFEKQVGSTYRVEGGFTGEEFDYQGSGKLFSVIPDMKSKVLLYASVEGQKYPLIVETRYGKGRFIYVAAELGYGNAEMELRNGSEYKAVENPGDRNLINSLLSYARRDKPPVWFDLPEGVQAVAYQLHGGPHIGDIYVHLLNTTGKDIQPGDKRYNRPEEMHFPGVKADLKIYTHHVTGKARAMSPMMEGEVKIEPTVQKGKAVITIPGKLLKEYLQVVIPAEMIDNQIINEVPIAVDAQ